MLELLAGGELEVLGLMPYSSNYVFLANVCAAADRVQAVYKPRRGERPLWDFPRGTLAARELASYVVSEAGGWGLVPPTVLRADAPLGSGSLQQFITHDVERHYLTMEDRLAEFEAFAAFDIVINNADRKSGHVIEDGDGKLWAVDHGLSFNVEDKLRTVIWEFAGEPVTPQERVRLEGFERKLAGDTGLRAALGELLSAEEITATRSRTHLLLEVGRYPAPDSQYRLPWPLI